MIGRVILKQGREKPVRQRHPWIFAGAVGHIDQSVEDGALADLLAADGSFLARGYVNRRSQILVRLLSWNEQEAIDAAFWRGRLARAIQAREGLGCEACRLINAEADGLPGLIVDRYGQWIVLQSLTLGIERAKPEIVAALCEIAPQWMSLNGIYERSDADVRKKEGLKSITGPLWGEEPPELIEIAERGPAGRPLRFLLDVRRGHKTGFYLDQQENRRAVAARCDGAETVNLFSYTGAFAVQALAAGARRVVNVDTSSDALALALRNLELNDFKVADEDFVQGNVFDVLRRWREAGTTFDAIILDPPKLAFSAAQVERAARAYKDLNLVSLQILRPGGILATFSCSGRISPDLFQKIVFGAALDAGREVQILEKLSHPPDHPILLSFPEGEYLKGLVCRVW